MLLTDLVSAFMLLTRLPVARLARFAGPPDLARCVWAFPIVGLAVNGIGGLVYWITHRTGMPPLLAAAWTLAATMVITGALHEDGLADTADGFGGGTTPQRKMEIMRDSRIGSYGAAALLLSVIARAAAIAALARPDAVATAMISAGMLGRTGTALLLAVLSPARVDGMAASVAKPRGSHVALALVVTVVVAFLVLPTFSAATAAVLLGFGCPFLLAKLAHAQIGGHTGDILGASEVITECVVLSALTCAFAA